MRGLHVDRPADLDMVRESYDRIADDSAHVVESTGIGDIRNHPWLEASIDAFADTVSDVGPVLDVGCGPGTVTAASAIYSRTASLTCAFFSVPSVTSPPAQL